MSTSVTLGGERLGSGKKQKVELHGFERSTHDLGYIWRSTMAAGTLVPFMTELALPGDSFDIDLDVDIMTHPTVGPLFGTFKVQVDVFVAPIRLYQGQLHNNALNIGMKMQDVKLPQLRVKAPVPPTEVFSGVLGDLDNSQINPSSLLSYLNIRGVGIGTPGTVVQRDFNAIPYLMYFDTFKNYYANKQEEKAYIINTPANQVRENVVSMEVWRDVLQGTLPEAPIQSQVNMTRSSAVRIKYSGVVPAGLSAVDAQNVWIRFRELGTWQEERLENIFEDFITVGDGTPGQYVEAKNFKSNINTSDLLFYSWRYTDASDLEDSEPKLVAFPLENIDIMRNDILVATTVQGGTAFIIDEDTYAPYGNTLKSNPNGFYSKMQSQDGLLVKTYQSDMFNNWMQTEWLDGDNGVNAISSVSVVDGKFSMDQLNLAKKVYDMMNRIAVSGGSYDDYLDASYGHERYRQASSPMYMGGLSKELVFQEVIANSEGEGQPLGTLAGRGRMNSKHKGGKVNIKVDEPSYIMGIISLTPRVDYSQGNKWDVNLKSIKDFHVPGLDGIGFQDLITDQMAWWSTMAKTPVEEGEPTFYSAGKQPAWMNYMTNVNQVRGNFAVRDNEMFMTLNRRYELDNQAETRFIKDLTTYIDPVKFNHIFAVTQRDAQNYWVQMGVDIIARRKMSAKVMPNL